MNTTPDMKVIQMENVSIRQTGLAAPTGHRCHFLRSAQQLDEWFPQGMQSDLHVGSRTRHTCCRDLQVRRQ